MKQIKWFLIAAIVGFFSVSLQAAPVASVAKKIEKPKNIRGIHLTCWVAGSKKSRARIEEFFNETEINSVVIAIKEYQGEVYIPGVASAEKYGAYVRAMPDIKEYLAELKGRGIYTIARMVVFKDKILPAKRPDLAVKSAQGGLWKDRSGNLWVDPYNKEVWQYNFEVAQAAINLGFDEVQFDYIRYPSDGKTSDCRYVKVHNDTTSAQNLVEFLEAASARFGSQTQLSIDVFGLTPSVEHGMGIGQQIVKMTRPIDYVSPMVYPSHYYKGEYGLSNPNAAPYKVVHKTMSDALRRMPEMKNRLRPWLQDFSLGHKYGPKEVRAQIQACEDLGIYDWLLWNASSRYTKLALRRKDGSLPPEANLPESMTESIDEYKAKKAARRQVKKDSAKAEKEASKPQKQDPSTSEE